ncbi:histidine kinase dimerization/phospho-acceptor domain-containing protein [Qipengyuania sediminis]|uniref:histidine kinase dimerization/phospho-acceptor domain-containing protein n=1 Tax=Qipengyuania sediminis TaxID=1532023 RepID=UPI001404E1EC|nr:histidine kinase dimerization/phospho-acceptor domain-containing protein [Qipengyuania sediminis]
MHFDDRLGTVLQHRAAGERAARVQFRQLLDLLADPGEGRDPALARAAYRRLDTLAATIPVGERERLAAESSARIRDPRLLAWFAAQEPRVALAALARAHLSEERWLALIPSLPIRARGLLRHRRNLPRGVTALLDRLGVRDRVLPEPEAAPQTAHSPRPGRNDTPALDLGTYAEEDYVLAAPPPPAAGGNLGDLVRRIEAFQKARGRREADAPITPPAQSEEADYEETAQEEGPPRPLDAFLFTADTMGRIDWAEGAAAPMVVGTALATPGALRPAPLAAAIARRRPVTGAPHDLAGAEAVAGRWIVDAAPRFEPRTGRYAGIVGRFRRPAPSPADTRALLAADRVRQLLHELRTPVTAIQGFAEVIQQQTVGPVPHEYRALAAGIAGDAARMLAGFAEIERLARLEAGTQELSEGASEFVAIARRQIAQLQTVLSPRVSRIEASFALRSATVPLAADHAEMIAWRVLATLAAATAAGETMRVSLTGAERVVRLAIRLPAALAQAEDVFAADVHPPAHALGTGLLGAGFALRLARAEARAVGGDLARAGDGDLVLTLPLERAERDPGHRPQREEAPAPNGGLTPRAPLAGAPRPR